MKENNDIFRISNEKIDINEYTKGIIVYAKMKPNLEYHSGDWIILITKTVEEIYVKDGLYIPGFRILRLASFNVNNEYFYCHKVPVCWGNSLNYDFYKATEAQKKFFISKLTENGLKYVKVLNKLIER